MQNYQRLAYLLGCYMVVADNEINSLEVEVLESYLPEGQGDEVEAQKQLIFSDDETQPGCANLLAELRLTNLTLEQKTEIVRFLADVAYGDDYLAVQEKNLLAKVAKILDVDSSSILHAAELKSKQRLEASRLNQAQRTIGQVENFIYELIPGQKSNSTIDFLLGSLGYSASVEEITDNAIVDLSRVSKIVDGLNGSLNATSKTLNKLVFGKKNSSKDVEEVAKIVSDIKSHFDNVIDVSLKDNAEILDKKSRNIRYFTIAFMGRTKAGKSTLHKVITQQENDDIGVGKLRTTRFNRSWYWNKLRIVDTPGIGAPGGAADTEIAKSIIDEADVICYIVTSDSIQETEFDFFETIKERNKPLYIVLNVKSNLTQPVRLKRFLENPNDWKDDTGPQSIKGHLDRIHERLDGKYNMDAVEIIPIHLLAAQMGFSKDYSSEDSRKLCEGSNILTFTRSLKSTVHQSGGLKKSLSVVDGTAYQIHQIGVGLNDDLENLRKGHDVLANKLQKFTSSIGKERTKLLSDIDAIFKGTKDKLCNYAAEFASENYDRDDAGERWENDSVVSAIYESMNDRLQQRMEDFNEKVKSQIEEIADDIKILGTFKAESKISGEDITNTRLRVGVLGSILTAAAPIIISNLWHPGGWVLAGVTVLIGVTVSIFTSLFTSKAEKIRKATEKMREQLCSGIDKGIEKNRSTFVSEVRTSIDATISTISTLLNTYVNGTKRIIHEIELLCQQCEESESAINSLVGFRILEYVGKRHAKDANIRSMDNRTLTITYPVLRDWTTQSITFKYKVGLSPKEIQKISQATQMKILNQ